MITSHLGQNIYEVSVKYRPVMTRYFVVSDRKELDTYVKWLKETWEEQVTCKFLGHVTTIGKGR